ncbi:ATP-binding protein [Shimia sediminis]|uniref:ATP-binding protein n=1 Tax=Shimia sediminis TaxID=2497945 RepID=UPI000F8E1665|nr:ATP-binding protein [Shimia sediminis]
MLFKWLKRYMPRSLYARAAMILILPIVTLQLVVTTAFIQRHFEGVTDQMTRATAREVNLVVEAINDLAEGGTQEAELEEISNYLLIRPVIGVDDPEENFRRWFDFSGIVVIRTFEERVPGLRRVELIDNRRVEVYVDTDLGLARLVFDRKRVSARNPHQMLVVMAAFGVLMTAISFLYMRNQLRPITRLSRAAEAFGRGRNVPYVPGGATEVRAAGNAFLDMRARIERQIEQRTMMLSGVSHDLRTPLTRLKLGLSLLDSEDAAPLEQDVEDMQRLLEEFLSFARGASEGEPEEVDPVALVKAIVEDSARGGSDVKVNKIIGSGTVMMRQIGVKRAVENLIGNAVRYGNRAEVSLDVGEKFLRIRVEDDGPGIAEEDREEAVKPFARLEPGRNQNKGTGVGLGLSIAADVARAHGGVLRLGSSERLGGLCADIVIGR